MKEKFTKGEWKIDTSYSTMIDIHSNETSVCEIDCAIKWINDGCFVADPTDEESANAHLIAAAPEMYQKLKELSKLAAFLEGHTHVSIEMDVVKHDIDELLKKARGEI